MVFRGSNAEAIGLLDAMHEGVVCLVHRTLMHRRKSARAEVVAAVEREMFRMGPSAEDEDHRDFLRLQRLIALLGDMEDEDGGGDIARFIEKYFAHIEQGPPQPPKPEPAQWRSEQFRTDLNRSFTWLLMRLGEQHSRQRYGDRLLTLRTKAKGRWKHEVQVALDGLRVEDFREVAGGVVLAGVG